MRAVVLGVCLGFVLGMSTHADAGRRKQLTIFMNKDKDIDLKNRTLYFKINQPADSAEIKVTSIEGKVLAERTKLYNGAKAGTRLSIEWPELLGKDVDNFRIDLKVTDTHDFWVGQAITKFWLEPPHEEVEFESGKWEIRDSETYKLDAPLKELVAAAKRYQKDLDCKLYIVGYTDTVGPIAANRQLSLERARAIARYFRKHGLKSIPMFVRGMGEEAPKVLTEDNVDEIRNRRARYILSNFPPEMPGPGSWSKI